MIKEFSFAGTERCN